MMQLASSEISPYVRKVKLVIALKGLERDIELVSREMDEQRHEALRGRNPLGKIPTLVLDDGTVIYDSPVICEYLDGLRPVPRLFPADARERIEALTLAALADGIADAAVLIVYEKRFRPEDKYVASWVGRQAKKIDAALDLLEQKPPVWKAQPDYGHISLASALAFLDIRHAGKWREGRPGLIAWLERFAKAVPAFAGTIPKG
jgi:glutathione S-transferase